MTFRAKVSKSSWHIRRKNKVLNQINRWMAGYATIRSNTQLSKQHDINQDKPYLQDSITADG